MAGMLSNGHLELPLWVLEYVTDFDFMHSDALNKKQYVLTRGSSRYVMWPLALLRLVGARPKARSCPGLEATQLPVPSSATCAACSCATCLTDLGLANQFLQNQPTLRGSSSLASTSFDPEGAFHTPLGFLDPPRLRWTSRLVIARMISWHQRCHCQFCKYS